MRLACKAVREFFVTAGDDELPLFCSPAAKNEGAMRLKSRHTWPFCVVLFFRGVKAAMQIGEAR